MSESCLMFCLILVISMLNKGFGSKVRECNSQLMTVGMYNDRNINDIEENLKFFSIVYPGNLSEKKPLVKLHFHMCKILIESRFSNQIKMH